MKETQHLPSSAVYSSPGALVARHTTAMAWRKRAIAEMQVSRVLEVSELLSHSLRKVPSCCLSHTALPREERVTTMETERLGGPCLEHEGRADLEFFKNLLVWSCSSSRLVDWAGGRGAERAVFIWQYSKFLKSMMALKEKRAEIKTLKWQLCHLLGVGYHQMTEGLWASSEKEQKEDFPGGPAIGNLHANAGTWVKPLHRKIPHVTRQLGPRATTTEHVRPRARALQEKAPQWEACAWQPEVAPAPHN